MSTASRPLLHLKEGNYVLKLAETPQEVDAALQLRFNVFNEELGEGLESSYQTGRDKDAFDDLCWHIVVLAQDGSVVGTYRMITREMLGGRDFYSASEFDMARMPASVLDQSIELGRACIAQEHRNIRVLHLLWKGICFYLKNLNKRYFFGCASLTSQDPAHGLSALEHIRSTGFLLPDFFLPAAPAYRCVRDNPAAPLPKVELPRLFKTYLAYGSRVCSEPAIDRDFKTIDFLIIFDVKSLDAKTYDFFFNFKTGSV